MKEKTKAKECQNKFLRMKVPIFQVCWCPVLNIQKVDGTLLKLYKKLRIVSMSVI